MTIIVISIIVQLLIIPIIRKLKTTTIILYNIFNYSNTNKKNNSNYSNSENNNINTNTIKY